MFVANMNKHLRVTSASRVSSQCLGTGMTKKGGYSDDS
ncbi:hypothetical protein WANA31_0945 [Wolbachia endosymbiont of Drosophila ananassae]|nr:hypothetical protein WANA31_0945 [Wolbachia endosymbiont of Drosophila ananassae]RLT62322.1 hypothetical protein WANA34_1025 [Wolbachia endosymbiont of Drosophila ananassae]